VAKVIAEETRVVLQPEWQLWLKVVGFGAAVGLIYWVLTLLIGRYIIEPLTCREVVDAVTCTEASVLAGKISTVLVAVGAIFAMIRLVLARPLIVAVGAAIVLWELSAWTLGLFWLESLAWSIILYALAYGLFGWIARHASVVVAIVTAAILAIAIRVALIFV
jgi:hypothetical protein